MHDAIAPMHVTMRRKNIVISDDVIDSGIHSAGLDKHGSSTASTKEASREQDLSDHYRGDAVVERDVGIGNQLVGSVIVGVPDAVAHCLNLSQPTSLLPSSLVSPSRLLKSS